MVWGCMGWNGAGILSEVDGIMDSEQYVEILEGGLMESVEKLEMDNDSFYFQQDNDPKRTSKLTSKWLEDMGINPLDWPAQSPDLNPIEHLWHYLKSKVREYDEPPRGEEEYWRRIEE